MKSLRAKQILITGLVALVLVAGYYRWTEENKMAEVANRADIGENNSEQSDLAQDYNNFEDENVVYVNADANSKNVDATETTDFTEARRERDSARGRSIDVLKEVAENEGSTDEARQEAQKKIADAASNIQSEGIIEGLVKAKGYSDCIVYIENEEVRVVVISEKLEADGVSRIKDIVVSQTGIMPKNIKISSKN